LFPIGPPPPSPVQCCLISLLQASPPPFLFETPVFLGSRGKFDGPSSRPTHQHTFLLSLVAFSLFPLKFFSTQSSGCFFGRFLPPPRSTLPMLFLYKVTCFLSLFLQVSSLFSRAPLLLVLHSFCCSPPAIILVQRFFFFPQSPLPSFLSSFRSRRFCFFPYSRFLFFPPFFTSFFLGGGGSQSG